MAIRSDALCSIAELQRYLSANAVTDFADHDEDDTADTDVVEDAINRGTVELMYYLDERYDIADLTGSSLGATLVNRWCVIASARYLCMTRGNPVPDVIETEWATIEVKLEHIRTDKGSIPGIAIQDEDIPTVSNMIIDRRYRERKSRVKRQTSSGASSKFRRNWSQNYNEYE